MKKFYSDYNQVKTRQIKAMLDDAKIPSFIKNEFIQGASGEIPPHETLPEIWLIDEQWENKALALVQQLESDLENVDNAEWICEACGENNEGQFMLCWQCQHSR